MSAILSRDGRVAIAEAIKNSAAIHMAWGNGDVSWGTSPPTPDVTDTALLAEVGRRQATQVSFCVPDSGGSITVPNGIFEISATPTSNLYFRFFFEFGDAVGQTIREQAIFLNTVRNVGVSPSLAYLTPAQISNPGRILVLQHSNPILREATTRQLFEFVVTF
jgi:hypothetical protein